MKSKQQTLRSKAIMYRNQTNKLLYDVAVVNHLDETAEVTLQKVQFEVASTYVEDYNSTVTNTI